MPRTKTAVAKATHLTEGSLALAPQTSVDYEVYANVSEETAEAVSVMSRDIAAPSKADKQLNLLKGKGKSSNKPKSISEKLLKVEETTPQAQEVISSTDKDIASENEILPQKSEAVVETVAEIITEIITKIPLADLHPPEFNPFMVLENDSLTRLTDSIKEYGVREPGLARPRKDFDGKAIDGYELLIGGRRKRACELAELPAMPVIIRDMNDDDAVIALVDSNLEQRDRLLPSEKAWAYRIKMEALNHKGIKGDKPSAEIIAEQTGDSRNQIFRFIRLTELIAPLLDKVDASKIKFNPAVELSYLSHPEQAIIISAMEYSETTPSLSQAKRIRALSSEGKFTEDGVNAILNENKPKTSHHEKISNRFRKYFPDDYSVKQMNDVIAKLLKDWQSGVLAQAGGSVHGESIAGLVQEASLNSQEVSTAMQTPLTPPTAQDAPQMKVGASND